MNQPFSESPGLTPGDQGKQLGLDLVESHAVDFLSVMRDTARRIVKTAGTVTTDDLRLEAQRLGIEPHHPNAWGAIFRGPGWLLMGYQKSRIPSNHSRRIGTWTLS